MSDSSQIPPVASRFTIPVLIGIGAALLLLRLGLATIFPLPISGDEAYYWDWSRQLASGYYSKPPFIAWAMGLADYTIGGEIGIRIHAALYATIGLVVWIWLPARMFDVRTAGWTALLLALSPASVALGLLLTIDAPLFAFSSIAVAAAWTVARSEAASNNIPILIVYGVSLALAHLTKQIAWILPILIPVALLAVDASARRRIPHLILTGALSFLALVPTIFWNAANGWPLAGHTLSHLSSGGVSFGRQAARFAEFLGSQLGLITPVTFVLVVLTCWVVLRHPRALSKPARFLAVLSVPGLLVFLALAFRQRVNPNWPLLFYPAALVLTAHLALQRPTLTKWLPRAAVVGGIFAAATAFSAPLLSLLGLDYSKIDPLKRLRGWPTYAGAVVEFNEALPGGPLPLIIDGHRYYVAQLAFYGPGHPSASRWEIPEKIHSQYEVWGPAPEAIAGPALLVTLKPGGFCREGVAASFDRIDPVGNLVFPEGTAPVEGLSFFIVEGWKTPPGRRSAAHAESKTSILEPFTD